MPKENESQSGVKTVQTMLAALKPVNKDSNQEKPAKQNKRSHSDVAEDSLEGIDLVTIHSDLKEIKQFLQGTSTKTDLDSAVRSLVKQSELKTIVTDIVSTLLESFRQSMVAEFETKLKDRTGKLQDQVDSLLIENENLKERLRGKEKSISSLQEQVLDNDKRSKDALKLANYNEQYSRKHNIRMLNYPEKKGEPLREDFVKMVKSELKVDLVPEDVQAIHRIPGKEGMVRPVIVKMRNTDVKIQVMREKKNLKNDVKFHDDITQRNLGLMARMKNTEKFENVWFYNCNVYGKIPEGRRIQFDIFDNIVEKLKSKAKL